MKQREISLINLVLDMLSHWRGFLAALVLGAVLLGGFGYVKSYQNYKQQLVLAEEQKKRAEQSEEEKEEEHSTTLKELEEILTEEQKLAVLTLIDDEWEYALKEEYVQNSIYYQMDPLNYYQGELVYKMQIADMEDSYMLGIVYEDMMNGVGLYTFLEEETGISEKYVRELISIDAKTTMTIQNGSQTVTMGNDSMKVTVFHANEEGCRVLLEAMKNYISKLYEAVEPEMGSHELVLLSEVTGVMQSVAVMNNQVSYNNTLYALLTGIAKTKAAFTEEQQQYYTLLSGNAIKITEDVEVVEEDIEEEPIVVTRPSVSMRYIVLGAVLFVFAYAAIIFIIYILNTKLRASDEFQAIFDVPQFGLIVKEGKEQFFVDKWIASLRNYGKRTFSREQSLQLAATAVKIAAVKNGLEQVGFIGCNMEAGSDGVCDSLKHILKQEQLDTAILNNVLYDAEAMEQLNTMKGVVLVEKAGSTLYEEVAKELELLARQDITVLGGIVVE